MNTKHTKRVQVIRDRSVLRAQIKKNTRIQAKHRKSGLTVMAHAFDKALA